MPRHKFQVTEDHRQRVKSLAGYGMRHEQIAFMLGLRSTTMLHKHFGQELVIGPAEAKSNVLNVLFRRAISGRDPASTMFWLKTRAGWSEKGNRPETPLRYERRDWIIEEYQPPTPAEHQSTVDEAVRRLQAAGGGAWQEWEGDKGDPQEDPGDLDTRN
jgi:hypothetical protein